MRWTAPALLEERTTTRFAFLPTKMGVPDVTEIGTRPEYVWLERYRQHERLGVYGWYVYRLDAIPATQEPT